MSRILSVLLGTLVLSGCVVTTYEGTSEAPRGPAQPIWPPLGKPAPSEDPTSGSSGHRANGNVEAISASHILVMYKGSRRAPPSITRSKDEARARAEEALARAKAGEDFAALAGEYSDEPGAAGSSSRRGQPRGQSRGHQRS